ncbi:MaoC family dehydratase [Alsobacter sp. SYSU BS001988]|jgi:acyl dehydratase
MPRLSFEDFEPGAVTTYGSYLVTREEIIAFASQYDPQPMHLDEAAAAGTLLGGLGSSGWHTCSMLMRMLYDNVLADSTGMGSGGIDEVKWKRPVRPGDRLSVRQTVLDSRRSSRGDRGYVRFRFEVLNQTGDVVMEQTNSIIFGVARPEAA